MTAEEPAKTYRFGIDAGSKTVKVVIVDEDGTVVNSIYRRHLSNIRETLVDILHNLVWRYGDLPGKATVTGSAGIALAEMLKLPFVQEVLATERAVRELYPDADAVIELGGEDAKVMYLSGNPEQRMNATCAGGTGGFIDTIAFMLGVRSSDMSRLAGGASRIYPIASRCAVFAQTDVRPLLNAGAKKSDIAASVLEAVVRQTITGLACGRPIEGKVIFLGGPLQFIPDLVRRFQIGLGLKRGEGIRPRWAHTFTAHGAALYAGELPESKPTSLGQLEERIRQADAPEDDLTRLEPLFATNKEREAFKERHARVDFPRKRLFDCKGPLYLGIDAGSTTVKMAVIDDAGNLVYSCYTPVQGDALATATDELLDFERSLPHVYGTDKTTAWVAHATATGYGEDLLCAALGIDSGIVETTAARPRDNGACARRDVRARHRRTGHEGTLDQEWHGGERHPQRSVFERLRIVHRGNRTFAALEPLCVQRCRTYLGASWLTWGRNARCSCHPASSMPRRSGRASTIWRQVSHTRW